MPIKRMTLILILIMPVLNDLGSPNFALICAVAAFGIEIHGGLRQPATNKKKKQEGI